jgi:predicted DNA-binding protein
MTKPRGVEWLEATTGETLDRPGSEVREARHLSVRLPADLIERLEEVAAQRGETVSRVARRLIAEGLAPTETPDQEALETAIAVLEKLRRGLESPAA